MKTRHTSTTEPARILRVLAGRTGAVLLFIAIFTCLFAATVALRLAIWTAVFRHAPFQ